VNVMSKSMTVPQPTRKGGEAQPTPRWHVLWTRSHCERLVHDQLAAYGFEPFLPELPVWRWARGARHAERVPLFPGYLFLRHAMDKSSYLRVCSARGLVRLLGERWDRLAVVPDVDVESIRRVLEANMTPTAHPYLREGRRVRVRRGPLAGAEGILVRIRPDRGLLVLSIDLFQRSVSVEIDCSWATAA
jgi:transcription antitermination factor NusG